MSAAHSQILYVNQRMRYTRDTTRKSDEAYCLVIGAMLPPFTDCTVPVSVPFMDGTVLMFSRHTRSLHGEGWSISVSSDQH